MVLTEQMYDDALKQAREVYDILNGIDWQMLKNTLLCNKEIFKGFYFDVHTEYADIDYKDITITIYKDGNKGYVKPQTIQYWNDEGDEFIPIDWKY